RVHSGSTPSAGEMFPSAAYHHATSIAAADTNGQLLNRWKNDDALGAVEQVARNIVWDVEDFFQYLACIFHSIHFFFVAGGQSHRNAGKGQEKCDEFFHCVSSRKRKYWHRAPARLGTALDADFPFW